MRKGELTSSMYRKLSELVRQRDRACREAYIRYLGEPPPETGEIHHIIKRSACGADDLTNLIFLSTWKHHDGGCHSPDPEKVREANEAIRKYMECDQVREWTDKHRDKVEHFRQQAREYRIRKTRAGCIPKKPDWAKF